MRTKKPIFMGPLILICFLLCPWLFLPGCDDSPGTEAVDAPPGSADFATAAHPDGMLAAGTPCADRNPYKNAYFGDLHDHTANSLDAYTFGTRAHPIDAYAFAAGHSLTLPNGATASGQITLDQGDTPTGPTVGPLNPHLDFMGVTDHSEWPGQVYACTTDSGDSAAAYASTYCKQLRANDSFKKLIGSCKTDLAGEGGAMYCPSWSQTIWQREQYVANNVNQSCVFTTFNAYEWTHAPQVTDPVSGLMDSATEHRNVFFPDQNVPADVFDSLKGGPSDTPAKLFACLHGDASCTAASPGCSGAACDALTIPHNMNKSYGQGLQLTAEDAAAPYADQYQILAEIHQHKGNSECITDTYDTGQTQACSFEMLPTANYPQYEPAYYRPALKRGLAAYKTGSGKTQLQLGIVGATDTHNATPGNVAETGWPGHQGKFDDTADKRVSAQQAPYQIDGVNTPATFNESNYNNPGGVTGVWATENTRPAIWSALKSRETFATSGARIKVRFYLYNPASVSNPCGDSLFPKQVVDAGGMPMGSTATTLTGAPSFVVYAMQDQHPLDSFDIIKGYYDPIAMQSKESIHHISLTAAPYCATWTDPHWSKSQPAFYYARVLQAATPRWSQADCATWLTEHGDFTGAVGCQPRSPTNNSINVTIQEHAWTSPIWYLP